MKAYTLDLPSLRRFAVGFDRQFDDLMRFASGATEQAKYPPYNVLQHAENQFSIEVAVAGFNEEELNVELQKGVLFISGKKEDVVDNEGPTYLHKGISTRSFTRNIPLAENIEVRGASVKNGILTVSLERIVPEEEKPQKIAIAFQK